MAAPRPRPPAPRPPTCHARLRSGAGARVLSARLPLLDLAFCGRSPVIVPRRNVEQACARTERRRIPVSASLGARLDVGGAAARFRLQRGDLHRPAFFVKAGIPVLLHEGFAHQELAADAVEDIEEAVAVGPEHHFARLSLPVDVGEHRDLHGVPIELVVGRELVVPFQLAGVGVEGDHRVGIQVVAGAIVAVPAGIGIAGSPICQVELGIVRAGHPNRAAAVLPRLAGPGLGDRIVGGHRRRVKAPDFFPGLDVVGADPAVGALLVGGRSENDLVLDHQRRHIQLVPLMPVDQGPVPVAIPVLASMEMRCPS